MFRVATERTLFAMPETAIGKDTVWVIVLTFSPKSKNWTYLTGKSQSFNICILDAFAQKEKLQST